MRYAWRRAREGRVGRTGRQAAVTREVRADGTTDTD